MPEMASFGANRPDWWLIMVIIRVLLDLGAV
jgi:hypothetical protein